jgi:hypothetical protein
MVDHDMQLDVFYWLVTLIVAKVRLGNKFFKWY